MSLRESFVEKFGEKGAARLEQAAATHEHYREAEGDQFKLVVLIAVAYHCIDEGVFRQAHRLLSVNPDAFYTWAVNTGDPEILAMLRDPDHLALSTDAVTKTYA